MQKTKQTYTMSKRIIFISFFLFSISFSVYSQNARNYTFSTNTTDTLVDMSTGTSTLINASTNNTASAVTSFGFEVWFMGTRFTDFSVNTNGVLEFGTNAVATGGNTYALANTHRISPYSSLSTLGTGEADPKIGAFGISATGLVHYKTIGTSPNRILVVEWLNVLINHNSPSPDYATFQAHIYETAPPPSNTQGGIIHFVYGEMNSDARNASNTPITIQTNTGLGAGVDDGDYLGVDIRTSPPDTSTDGSANSFGVTYIDSLESTETAPNLHSTTSTARRFFDFDPPALNGQATTATLQCAGPSQVVVTWSENATNEVGSVIYRSTDGTNFDFLAQTAQGVTDYTDNTVTANTTYYYRFYLVSEGKLSELAGTGEITVTTPAATSIYAVQTGNWNTVTTWSTGAVPTSTDDVIIGCNYTVSVDAGGMACDDLSVLSGAELNFRDNGTLDINGNLSAAGTFDMNGTSISLNIGGDITNSGTWDPGDATVTLDGTDAQTITNTGNSDITVGTRQNVTYTSSDASDPTGQLNTSIVPALVSCEFDEATYISFTGDPSTTTDLTDSRADMSITLPSGSYNAVASITFSITHAQNQDLEILIGDGANVHELSTGNGGASDNYDNVTLTDGASNAITTAAPGDGNAITGSYRPECITMSTDLTTAGGTVWTLYAHDTDFDGVTGTMTAFSITMDSGQTTNTTYSDIAFYNLIINNTNAGGITLNDSMRIVNALTLTDGIITTAHEVIFFDDATSTVGSNDAHIDGVVRKIGDDAFDFPTGDDGFVGNFAISAPSSITDEFTVQYLHVNPNTFSYTTTSLASGINNVSVVEFWEVNQPVGSSAVTLSASYENTRSEGVSDPNDLLIVHWDGSEWISEGNGGAHGGGFTGITTSGTVASFSPFTLANTDHNENPLPVTLLDFEAERVEDAAKLTWKTATEINSDYFEIERSTDGQVFSKIAEEKAAGESSTVLSYQYLDFEAGIANHSRVYYRLKMIDRDGSFEYSSVRVVFFDVADFEVISAYPNPIQSDLNVEYVVPHDGEVYMELVDVLGRSLVQEVLQAKQGMNDANWNTIGFLPQGTYILILQYGNKREKIRLVK